MPDDAGRTQDLDSLARRAAVGDGPAESALFLALGESLRRVAKRRVREEELDDCVQDALRVVLRKYRDRPGGVGIVPFSFAVLRRVVGNVYRRRPRADAHDGIEAAAEVAAGDVDPLGDRQAARTRATLVEAIRRLDSRHPRCARLFRGILAALAKGDAPDEVVGGALDALRRADASLTRGNFHVILHRCRARLREEMERLGGDA
jgi:DNA-directed RNA polymerase specialized sigma24 family protein